MVLDIHRDAAQRPEHEPLVRDREREGLRAPDDAHRHGRGRRRRGASPSSPTGQENYKLAEALTEGLNERIPGICRDIMVKTGRYNQHMSERAVLIEVGHNENTLQEALNATEPLADVIADLLLDPASAFAS